MEVQQDFKELFALLNAHGVEYVIVGGYALAYHGAPRYTGDMDVFVKADMQNASRILATLSDFGFESRGLTVEDFALPDKVVQLGYSPVRVDIVTSITGVSWDDARSGAIADLYGDVPVIYIGREHLIANKRSVGRRKDLADLEALGEE